MKLYLTCNGWRVLHGEDVSGVVLGDGEGSVLLVDAGGLALDADADVALSGLCAVDREVGIAAADEAALDSGTGHGHLVGERVFLDGHLCA